MRLARGLQRDSEYGVIVPRLRQCVELRPDGKRVGTSASGGLLPSDDAPERPVSASEPSSDAFAGMVLDGFDRRAVCSLLKWLHNLYYANRACDTKGSEIDHVTSILRCSAGRAL